MTSSLLLRARAVWLFGAGLVFAGVLVLLYLVALFAQRFGVAQSEVLGASRQYVEHSLLSLLSELPPAWLTSLHLAMGVALLGAAVAALGVFVARRQAARIRAGKSRRDDAQRRVYEYRDASRLEPYIGWPDDPRAKSSPQVRKMHSLPGTGPC